MRILRGLRRPRLGYANVASTLALLLAVSMGGAYAHGKIGSGLIKSNAVKSRHIGWQQVKTGDLAKRSVPTNRIKAKAVTKGKLHPSARTRITVFTAPGHDFGADFQVTIRLPIELSPAQIAASEWTVKMLRSGLWYEFPGSGSDLGQTAYRVFTSQTNPAVVIGRVDGPGETYEEIKIFRTVPTRVDQSPPTILE